MKNLIVLLALLGFAVGLSAQARLGATERQIRDEFDHETFTSGVDNDGDRYITFNDGDITVAYYFNSSGICFFCIVIPLNQGEINAYVERFNKQYVIISETSWKAYTQGGIMEIILRYDKARPYFTFKGL